MYFTCRSITCGDSVILVSVKKLRISGVLDVVNIASPSAVSLPQKLIYSEVITELSSQIVESNDYLVHSLFMFVIALEIMQAWSLSRLKCRRERILCCEPLLSQPLLICSWSYFVESG